MAAKTKSKGTRGIEPAWVSNAQLSAMLGISMRQVNKLRGQLPPVAISAGRSPKVDAISAIRHHLRTLEDEQQATGIDAQLKQQKLRAAQLKIEQAAGRLVNRDELLEALKVVGSNWHRRVEQGARKHGPEFVDLCNDLAEQLIADLNAAADKAGQDDNA